MEFVHNYSLITGFPEPILNNTFKPVLLISGNYNVFETIFDKKGSYMCSGLYVSDSFKLPIYIGGSETIQDRIERQHISKLEKDKHPHNPPLQNSWNEHSDKEGFVWWLLEESINEPAWITEQRWLNYYRPFADEKGGFNVSHCSHSGMGGRKHTLESRIKLSIIVLSQKRHIIFTKEALENSAKARTKKVKQIDKITGEVIKIWNSSTEASKNFNSTTSSGIRNTCNKKRKTAYGFKWEFV